MKIKIKNKTNLIIILVILLLVLAVGYAAFSDILTISGTANAKGTFGLEFQNAEIVKNVGADIEKTTAVISEDKDTLAVNVSDLSYPGSGVEFSVDIVNVGSIPAEVQAVTPTNITGSKKIKVTGLDVIKTDHPKIEPGDRCNIHFTVEWQVDSGEILENESSISFGLQIEYTQSTGEAFEGETYHSDLDEEGNVIRTDRIRKGKLIEIIEPQDYGRSINYIARVTNNETKEAEEVSNWKVLYNDKTNIYLILDDFLPNKLISEETGVDIWGKYVVYSKSSVDSLLNGLKTESYWSEFANGIEGAIATGSPTVELIIESYNQKYGTNMNTLLGSTAGKRELDNTDTLYVPHKDRFKLEIEGTRLASGYTGNSNYIWFIYHRDGVLYGNAEGSYYTNTAMAVRPVVKLPSTVAGTVGETVEINY